jgi:hypothetical protein
VTDGKRQSSQSPDQTELQFQAKKGTSEEAARRTVARMPTTVSGHWVKLVLTLFLPHDVAEYIAACAIREGKNTPGAIGDILNAESRRRSEEG